MVGRKPKGSKAKQASGQSRSALAQPEGDYQMHVDYDENGVFYEDAEVDHDAVANAASKKRRGLGKLTTLGLLAFTCMASLIAVNAAFLQDVRHPSPLIATRASQSQLDGSELVKAAQKLKQRELVVDVQKELRRLGAYPGSLDGQFGPATERAIRLYQRQRAMNETGKVTEALLARLTMDFEVFTRTSDIKSEETAVPVPRASPDGIAELAMQSTGSATSLMQNPTETERIKRLQKVLAKLGYGPLTIDGIPGGQTEAAIAAFQRAYKLKVDGKMSDALLAKIADVSGTRI